MSADDILRAHGQHLEVSQHRTGAFKIVDNTTGATIVDDLDPDGVANYVSVKFGPGGMVANARTGTRLP